jgi:hypothetical protein
MTESKMASRRLSLAACASLLAAAIVSCASNKVSVKVGWDQHADFTKYKTWGWKTDGSIQDQVWERRCHSVLADELLLHHLTEVPADQADLWAVVHAKLDVKTQVASFSPAWGYGWGPYGSAWAYDDTIEYDVPYGTIVLDLVDRREKQIVWRGRGKGVISADRTNEEREEKLIGVFKQMFAGYPPIANTSAPTTGAFPPR